MSTSRRREADPDTGGTLTTEDLRNETTLERYDRNWAELMQELRITQMGSQIMTGFLLAVAFQPRFDQITPFQHALYLALVVLGVGTTALGLAPVHLHRRLFRQGMKLGVVEIGHLIVKIMIIGVGLLLVGTVTLIFDVTVGRVPALVVAGLLLALLTAIAIIPSMLARRLH